MHHLPAVTIYNKGSAGGRGYSLGSSRGNGSGWGEGGLVAQRLHEG